MPPTLLSPLPLPLPPPPPRPGCRRPRTPGELGLLVAVHQRLADTPAVRADVVSLARARLCVQGPPSAERLADLLVDHLCAASEVRGCPGALEARRYA